MEQSCILSAVRTPTGKFLGALSPVAAPYLLPQARGLGPILNS
jgi:hypothetical protein